MDNNQGMQTDSGTTEETKVSEKEPVDDTQIQNTEKTETKDRESSTAGTADKPTTGCADSKPGSAVDKPEANTDKPVSAEEKPPTSAKEKSGTLGSRLNTADGNVTPQTPITGDRVSDSIDTGRKSSEYHVGSKYDRPKSTERHEAEGKPRVKRSGEVVFEAKRRRRKNEVDDPNAHKVTFTVTVAKAIPTLEDGDQPDIKQMMKKKRRIVEAPRAQNYYHLEYYLLPDDPEPVKTDVVTFGMAAKIFTERQDPKVLKTWQDGEQTWVAWTHCHTIAVNEDLLLKLFKHNLVLRVWDTKDKVSVKARFDKPKSFRLPQAKAGEDVDNIGGVKSLVLKQSRSYEKTIPRRSYIDRPLPSQTKLPSIHPELPLPKDKDKGNRARKEARDARAAAGGREMPDKLADYMDKAGHTMNGQQPPATPTTNTLVQVPIKQTPDDKLRSYSRLGRLAGVTSPVEPAEPTAKRAGGREAERQRVEKQVRSKSQPPPIKDKNSGPRVGSTPDKKDPRVSSILRTAETESSSTSKMSKADGSSRRRNRKAEAAAQAAAEQAKKFGVCNVSIPMKKLFAGLQTVTERLEKPVTGIDDVFLTVSVSGHLMSEEHRCKLNPLILKTRCVTNMPDTPLTYPQLRLRCQPAYIKYNFMSNPVHQSVGREQDKEIYWDDVNVVLAGIIEPSELREYLNGPPLEIQVHDRDRVTEAQKLKATLFGDDLEDEKISNVGVVSGKRTVHNPFHGRDKPWDPYGVAKIDLSGLLLGQQILHVQTPIHCCPLPDVLGVRDGKQDGKLLGVAGAVDGPVDSPLPVGHYLDSGAMLKVKIELAYPLTTPNQLAAKQDLGTTSECPFNRLVFKFDYHNLQLLHRLQRMITDINARALKLDHLPQHIIESALSTYKLSLQQQGSRDLDIVTGFQVMDGTMHLFVIEGLSDQAVLKLWEALPKPESADVEVLYHSDLSFRDRLYGPLDVDLCRIKLHEPLSVIVQQPLLYVRDMVPKPCFEALVKLDELVKMDKLRDVVRNDLFPTAEMVVSMSREFGVPLTSEDFEELTTEVQQVDMTMEVAPPTYTSRQWTPIDNVNPEFVKNLETREQSGHQHDYITENKDQVQQQSRFNSLQRSKTMPVTVRADVKVAHNYSTQTLNSTEQAKEVLRQQLAKHPDHRFTYCPEYQHSMTVVPVNVDAIKKSEDAASKAAWRTPNGWTFPGKKTMRESNIHPKKPDQARIDEIYQPWVENVLHQNKLDPTLGREGYTWSMRGEDMNLWRKPPTLFGSEPITIHEAGRKLQQEKHTAQHLWQEQWRSKINVDDIRMYFHRCATETELLEKGFKSSNQLDRLHSLLKDTPQKYTLSRPGYTLQDIPPLNVVLNPSVDTHARISGLPTPPAVPGEGLEKVKGFGPGPYREHSWLLERNKIPVHDYQHKLFAETRGHDFNVYHKERSNLHKRTIIPLADEEYDNHLFRLPPEIEDFHHLRALRRSYILPDLNEFKQKQMSADSGFGSFTKEEPKQVEAVAN